MGNLSWGIGYLHTKYLDNWGMTSKVYVVTCSSNIRKSKAFFYFRYFQLIKNNLCAKSYCYGTKYLTSKVWGHVALYICPWWSQTYVAYLVNFVGLPKASNEVA